MRQEDDDVIKARVLIESRSSDYRDVDTAIERNRARHERQPYPREKFSNVGHRSVDDIVESILADINIPVSALEDWNDLMP